MLTKILFLDFESQGQDTAVTNITEMAASLWEGSTKVKEFASLCYAASYPPQTPEIVDLTGISDAMLKSSGGDPAVLLKAFLYPLVEEADYVLAHNLKFDEGLYRAVSKRLGLTPAEPKKGWVCTLQDVPYPAKYKCKKLSHLALDHGVRFDHRDLHRASGDIDLLARLVFEHYPLEKILSYRETPWAYVKANVPAPWTDGGAGVAAAKLENFSWEKIWATEIVFPKSWVKRVKEDELESYRARLPFETTRVYVPKEEG